MPHLKLAILLNLYASHVEAMIYAISCSQASRNNVFSIVVSKFEEYYMPKSNETSVTSAGKGMC